ncbi:ABC transporter ATP-binding protein, partial [Campylobacter jejuni]|nr:ABC transporter ATP-binding protein [Campylobacter jejuni]
MLFGWIKSQGKMMLEIKNLSKNFEKIQALENINLHVKEG